MEKYASSENNFLGPAKFRRKQRHNQTPFQMEMLFKILRIDHHLCIQSEPGYFSMQNVTDRPDARICYNPKIILGVYVAVVRELSFVIDVVCGVIAILGC